MTTPGNPPGGAALMPGQVQLFDNAEPTLHAGVYTVTATSAIADSSGHASFQPFAQPTQVFEVMGPHYTIDPTTVHSRFPPVDGSDDYGEFLPQIVFAARMLPWRRVIGDPASADAPWLALLLFNPSEAVKPPGADRHYAVTGLVQDFLTPPAGYAVPDDPPDPAKPAATTACRYFDLPMDLFRRIAPKAAELPYLAHWRNVDTASGGVDGDTENGTFSAVIGNRLPSATELNIVHLVSLVGFAARLPDSPADGSTMIRLLSLASWSFMSHKTAISFTERVSALKPDVLQLTVTKPEQSTPVQTAVANTLAQGFVPLTYRRREGEPTAGWYRGPLSTVAIAEAAAPGATATPFQTSDAALIYDPDTGMLELSYAIAWQTGRLLSLADKKFCVDLLQYRAALKSALMLVQQRILLLGGLPILLAPSASPQERMAPRAVSAMARRFLLEDFAGLVTDPAQPLFPRARDRLRLAERSSKIPGVLPREELAALLASGRDPLDALLERVFAPGGED